MTKTVTVVTVGEILVEFVSHRHNCALEQICDYSGPYPSGAPAIFLDQAARMGVHTEMIGGVGADGFGRSVLQRLKKDRVGCAGINVSQDRSTGVAFVSYYDSGARDFIFHLAGTAADHFELPVSLFNPSEILLHVSASSLGSVDMRDKIMSAVHTVSEAGGRISCDPNARPELISDASAMSAIREVMDLSYCLLPSTSDLEFLYPELSEDAAIDKLLNAQADVIAIKRGADGATIVGHDQRHDFDGHSVHELDPTGAGDCFCGTFISLLAQGSSLFDAGKRANAAGAIAVTRRGPMEGNSGPAEIDLFLSNNTNQERSL